MRVDVVHVSTCACMCACVFVCTDVREFVYICTSLYCAYVYASIYVHTYYTA